MRAGAAESSLGAVPLLSSLGSLGAQDLIAFAVAPLPPAEGRPQGYRPQIRQWVAPPNFYGY